MATPQEQLEIIKALEKQVGKSFIQFDSTENLQWISQQRYSYVFNSNIGITALGSNHYSILDLDFSLVKKFSSLTQLDQLNARILDLSPLKQLTNLQNLSLAGCNINNPEALRFLTQLRSLNLNSTGIKDLKPLQHITSLQSLFLENNGIQDLEPLLPLIKDGLRPTIGAPYHKQGIHLSRNSLGNPPKEVVAQGGAAVIAYFEKLKDESRQPLNEVKLLLIGDGEVGKTSLSKGLRGVGFNNSETQTHGIQIHQWCLQVPSPTGLTDITTHLWDFGGQEVMHATHQFFLTSRSCYILVLDGRRDERPEYWLKHIESFGGRSPVLVVMNKADENPGYDLNRKDLQTKFPNIIGFYRTSCKTNEGLDTLKKELEKELGQMEILQEQFPESWMAVKDWVTHLKTNAQKDYISMERFREACNEHTVTEETTQESLIAIFQQLGLAFCYKHDLRTLVFNPQWLTHAVYRLINAKAVAQRAGEIWVQDLGTILQKCREGEPQYRQEHYPYILGQMVAFQLCYEVEQGTRWLLPDLLPETPPDYETPDAKAIGFYFTYDFLPKSIFPRLLVAHHTLLEGGLQWRTGCVLRQGKAVAEVMTDYEAKQVRLTVYAQNEMARIGLLAHLRGTLEDIHRSFSETFQSKVMPMVPVPSYPGAAIAYHDLCNALEMRQAQMIVPGHRAQVSVDKLLKGVDMPSNSRMDGGTVEIYNGPVYKAERVTADSFIQGNDNQLTVSLPQDLAEEQGALAPQLVELITEMQRYQGAERVALLDWVDDLSAPQDMPSLLGTLGKVLGHANNASTVFLNARNIMNMLLGG